MFYYARHGYRVVANIGLNDAVQIGELGNAVLVSGIRFHGHREEATVAAAGRRPSTRKRVLAALIHWTANKTV